MQITVAAELIIEMEQLVTTVFFRRGSWVRNIAAVVSQGVEEGGVCEHLDSNEFLAAVHTCS
jgi:hypothetical protein